MILAWVSLYHFRDPIPQNSLVKFRAPASRSAIFESDSLDRLLHSHPVLITLGLCVLGLDHGGKVVQHLGTARPLGPLDMENDLQDGLFSTSGLYRSHLSTSRSLTGWETTNLISQYPVASQTIKTCIEHGQRAVSLVYYILYRASA